MQPLLLAPLLALLPVASGWKICDVTKQPLFGAGADGDSTLAVRAALASLSPSLLLPSKSFRGVAPSLLAGARCPVWSEGCALL